MIDRASRLSLSLTLVPFIALPVERERRRHGAPARPNCGRSAIGRPIIFFSSEIVEDIMTKLLVVFGTGLALMTIGGVMRPAMAVTAADCHIRHAVCAEGCQTRSCHRLCKEKLRLCLRSANSTQ